MKEKIHVVGYKFGSQPISEADKSCFSQTVRIALPWPLPDDPAAMQLLLRHKAIFDACKNGWSSWDQAAMMQGRGGQVALVFSDTDAAFLPFFSCRLGSYSLSEAVQKECDTVAPMDDMTMLRELARIVSERAN